MIEKICEELAVLHVKSEFRPVFEREVRQKALMEAMNIVREVAKEYGNADFISRSVLLDKLQKWKFANEERGYDTATDLIQEMIDLVKEQPSAPYQKGE